MEQGVHVRVRVLLVCNIFSEQPGQCFKISMQRIQKPSSCKLSTLKKKKKISFSCENILNELKFGIT